MVKIPHLPKNLPSHPDIRHPYAGLNDKLADRISTAFGSMAMFWTLMGWQLSWMILATLKAPLFKGDPYPFIFLLFLGNLVQLWSLPILGTTQNRADEKRNAKADVDHEANVYLATRVDAIDGKLDALLEAAKTGTPERGTPL